MKIKELGHVVLYVTNLEKISYFYREILGFNQIAKKDAMAVFSTGRTHHELLLIEIGGNINSDKKIKPGLYHIGFKIGDKEEDLKNAIKELKKHKIIIIGGADHTVTKSIYIQDPDENELELYIDTTDKWKNNPDLIITPPKPLNLL